MKLQYSISIFAVYFGTGKLNYSLGCRRFTVYPYDTVYAQNKEIYRRATQWCNVSPFFYAKIMQYLARRRSSQPVQRVYWPFCWLTCIYLAGVMADSMRNAICVATQTSKVPTRVALLYISLFCGIRVMDIKRLHRRLVKRNHRMKSTEWLNYWEK